MLQRQLQSSTVRRQRTTYRTIRRVRTRVHDTQVKYAVSGAEVSLLNEDTATGRWTKSLHALRSFA